MTRSFVDISRYEHSSDFVRLFDLFNELGVSLFEQPFIDSETIVMRMCSEFAFIFDKYGNIIHD